MDALGIGASFKPLIAYENWSRYRQSKRRSIVGNARRDNELAIDRANKAAAEATAASEAGSSQAGPSVRDRSNSRSPLAMLTTRCLAQRAGTLAGLARWWGVARATASSLMAAVMQVLPSSSPAHILAKFGAPPDPTKPREVCARVCVCGCSSRVAHRARVSSAVCVGLAPLRGFQCKKLKQCSLLVLYPPCFDGTTAGQPFRHFGGRSHRGNLRPHPDVHSARCSQDSAWACWAAQITRGDCQRIGGAHHLCDVGGGAGSL